jgi:two-component sensor histidine kinase
VASGVVVWAACAVWILRLLSADTATPKPPSASAAWPIASLYDLMVVVGNIAASALFPTAAVIAGGLPRSERGPEAAVRVELDDDLHTRLPGHVQATAYRVVVEGLTNVRRHAAPGCPVTVSLIWTSNGAVSVAVVNDVDAIPSDRHRRESGGTGLTALRERVSAVGGCLEAGPDGSGRWRLWATLPNPNEGDVGR